jgi:hypothetical protein
MFTAFLNRTSRIVIAERTTESRHHARTQHELTTLGEYKRGSSPFSKSNPGRKPARSEVILASLIGVASR